MTSAVFVPCRIIDAGRPRHGFQIACGKCGTVDKVAMNTFQHGSGGAKEARVVQRRFEERGWVIGSTAGKTRCMDCARHTAKLIVVTKGEDKPMAPAHEAPREMSRDDRRLIFAKLHEVYVDDQVGYSGEWSDKRVAQDLGVPLAWIAAVRDEHFGPAVNENHAAALAAAGDALAQMRAAADEAREVQAAAKALLDRANAVMQRIAALEPAVNRSLDLVRDIEKIVKP